MDLRPQVILRGPPPLFPQIPNGSTPFRNLPKAHPNYIAQATVNGCSTFDTVNILVNPIPVTIANSNSPVCENDTIKLTFLLILFQ